MRKLLVQPQARVDLLEIWHRIAPDSIDAANKVADRLDAAIRGLAQMPGKGHRRADVKASYRYDEQTLTVVRVVHGRCNFRQLFKR